ncbi:MAG: hypothetical protein RRB13_00560 [bacterium]|nr:hypothetical protein [bacterium]
MSDFFSQFDQGQFIEHEGHQIAIQLTPPDQIEDFSKVFFPYPAGLVVVTGGDRVAYLNGLGPTDLRMLKPGEGTRCLFTDNSGHVIFDTHIFAEADRVLIFTDPGEEVKLHKHLDFYAITEDVQFEISKEPLEMAMVFGFAQNAETLGGELILSGNGGFAVLFGAAGFFAQLAASGFTPIGMSLYEELRPLFGIVRPGVDYGAHQLPQEAALEPYIEFQKGCYLGQEPISRIKFRGRVRQRLEQVLSQNPLEPDQPLMVEDKQVGKVTSPSQLQTEQGYWNLAYLDATLAEDPLAKILANGEVLQVPRFMAQWAAQQS